MGVNLLHGVDQLAVTAQVDGAAEHVDRQDMYQRYRVSFFHRPFLVPETVASLRTYPGGHGGQHYQNQEPLFHLGENRYLCERRTFAGQAVPCALPAGLPLSPVCIIFAADKSGGGSELSSGTQPARPLQM